MAYVALLIYAAVLFIRPMDWIGFMVGWRLIFWTVILAVTTWIASIQQSGWKLKDSPQNKLMIGLFVATIASHLMHFDPYFDGARQAFADFGKVLILYLLVASLLDSPKKIRCLLVVIGIGILFMSLNAILQVHDPNGGLGITEKIRQPDVVHGVVRAKGFGFCQDPNDLALVLVASLPFFLAPVFRKGGFVPTRMFSLLCLVPITYAVYLTKSRGGWLALALTLGAFYAVNFFGKRGKKVALVFGAILFMGVIFFAPGRMGQYDAGDASARGRWAAWGMGSRMLKRAPVFGVGMDMFTDDKYNDSGLVAHNSYVHCYSELGLFGYFFFVALLAISLKDGYTMSQLTPGDNETRNQLRDLARSAVPGMIGYLAACFFLSRTYEQPLYILIGIFAAMRRIYDQQESPPEPMFSLQKRWRPVVALEIGSVAFIYMFTRVMMARG